MSVITDKHVFLLHTVGIDVMIELAKQVHSYCIENSGRGSKISYVIFTKDVMLWPFKSGTWPNIGIFNIYRYANEIWKFQTGYTRLRPFDWLFVFIDDIGALINNAYFDNRYPFTRGTLSFYPKSVRLTAYVMCPKAFEYIAERNIDHSVILR